MRLETTIAIAMMVAGVCVTPLAAHPHAPIAVRVNPQDKSELQLLDYATGETRLLFRSQKGAMSEILVSPYFARIAVVETTTAGVGANRFTALPTNSLVVIDTRGEILRSVERDVRQVVFSPDGRKLGFLTGAYYGGGVGFKPTGAHVLDIDSGEIASIPGVDLPYRIEWARDGAIYLKTLGLEGGPTVFRYDLDTQRVTESESAGFNFSPDGGFHLSLPYETVTAGECEPERGVDSCLRVVNRRTGELVPFFSSDALGHFDGWAAGDGHELMFSKREFEVSSDSSPGGIRRSESFVYDAATTVLVETFECERPSGASEGQWITSTRFHHCRDASGTRFIRGYEEPVPEAPAPPVPPPPPPPEPTPVAGQPTADSEWTFANPLFKWQGLEGADNYNLRILADPEGLATVQQVEGLQETRWRSEPMAVGEYYWQVTALSGGSPLGAPMPPVRFVILSAEADSEPPATAAQLRGAQTRALGQLVSSESVELETEIEDSLAGVDSKRVRVNGREIALGEFGGPWVEGANVVEIDAEDRAGNASVMEPFRFSVDKQPPEIKWRFVRPEELQLDQEVARRLDRLRRSGNERRRQGIRWLEVSDDASSGRPLTWGHAVSQDRDESGAPGRWRPVGGGGAVDTVKSDQPQLFISSPGARAFADSVDTEEGEVLWVSAVDHESRTVKFMSVRVREDETMQTGARFVLEITAADMFGNTRSELLPLHDQQER